MDQILNVLVFGLLLGGIYGLVSIGLNLIFGVVRIEIGRASCRERVCLAV